MKNVYLRVINSVWVENIFSQFVCSKESYEGIFIKIPESLV